MESVWEEFAVIVALILANGFFAGAELAIISARKSRIAHLLAAGDQRAKTVERLQNDPHRFLATVQIGVTLVGTMASAVGGVTAVQFIKPLLQAAPFEFVRDAASPLSLAIVVVIVSYFSLILGELVPKALALHYADSMALLVAKPIDILARVGGLAVAFLTLSSKAVLCLMGVRGEGEKAFIAREEVAHIVAEGRETGVFSATEQEFIKNILDFSRTSVREVMVPRTRMAAIDLDLSRDEILRLILENQYSRYPVFSAGIENIAGFIHAKDFLGEMVSDADFDMASIIRPPFYVPEGKKVNELLKEMQRNRSQIALVVDEYGGISGLVTTEDLLEELVGEIEDEHDAGDPQRVQRFPDGSLLMDALISINDLEDLLQMRFGETLPYDTLAGLILHQLGRFPERGEQLEVEGFLMICEEVKENAIVRVRIVRRETEGP
ncbi:MAG: hemolysin family protein [Geobacteraceae bacterium]